MAGNWLSWQRPDYKVKRLLVPYLDGAEGIPDQQNRPGEVADPLLAGAKRQIQLKKKLSGKFRNVSGRNVRSGNQSCPLVGQPFSSYPTNIGTSRAKLMATPLVVISDGGVCVLRFPSRLLEGLFLSHYYSAPAVELGQPITKGTLATLVGTHTHKKKKMMRICRQR